MSAGTGGGRRPGRPPQLSRERIVDAVATFDDVDALTMRDLAGRLDVRHAALYRWVGSRDALFDLVSEVVVDRVLAADGVHTGSWRRRLARLARAMHDEFGAFRGYSTHLSRPHQHNAHSVDRLRQAVVAALEESGVDASVAEASWYVFIRSVVSWLAFAEQPADLGPSAPPFEVFLGVLLRGLPAREPGAAR